VRAVGQSSVVGEASSWTLIEHVNGTARSVVASPSPGSVNDLAGVTTSNAGRGDGWLSGRGINPAETHGAADARDGCGREADGGTPRGSS
jgi:hypothetical protein